MLTADKAATRRQHERVKTRLVVTFGQSSPEFSGEAENLSEEGLFISTGHTFRVGTRLILQIEFPDRVVSQHGEVVWSIPVPEHMRGSMVGGIGIQFIYPDPQWPAFFRAWRDSGDAA